MTAFADYYDGRAAKRRRVSLRIDGQTLLIEEPEADPLRWNMSDLRQLPDRALGGMVVVALGAGPERLVAGGDVGAHLKRLVPRERPAEARPLFRAAIVTSLVGTAFLAALFFVVLPVLA
ncbi:MAG: hypothetical protein AAGF30_11960, partial [Pseudomonadota bacterium]